MKGLPGRVHDRRDLIKNIAYGVEAPKPVPQRRRIGRCNSRHVGEFSQFAAQFVCLLAIVAENLLREPMVYRNPAAQAPAASSIGKIRNPWFVVYHAVCWRGSSLVQH
jgi:hypothetical protein